MAADETPTAAETAAANTVYVPSTLANVSDVLFRKGILRTDDPAAVEEYVRIHRCGLYEEYGQNDFAWTRIREAQARDLDVHLRELPDGLEVTSAIGLDQYDLVNNEFLLDHKDFFENTGLVTAMHQDGGSVSPCDGGNSFMSFVPRTHPLTLIVKIDAPITMKSIPMDRKKADILIASINKRKAIDHSVRREATMVMRIRISAPDPLTGVTDPLRRTVLGTLDEIRVYDGPEKKELLFKRDYQSQREKNQKK